MLNWMFRSQNDQPAEEGEGPVIIRVELNGKTYTRRYPDLDLAQIRFPQFLAELGMLHAGGRNGGTQ